MLALTRAVTNVLCLARDTLQETRSSCFTVFRLGNEHSLCLSLFVSLSRARSLCLSSYNQYHIVDMISLINLVVLEHAGDTVRNIAAWKAGDEPAIVLPVGTGYRVHQASPDYSKI